MQNKEVKPRAHKAVYLRHIKSPKIMRTNEIMKNNQFLAIPVPSLVDKNLVFQEVI